MAVNPDPLSNMLRLAAAAFVEAGNAFAEVAGLSKPEGKEAVSYGYGLLASGFAQVEAVSKNYAALPECARNDAAKPVLTNGAFRSAINECAEKLAPLVSTFAPAARVEASLRRLIEMNNPSEARTLAMVCNSVSRSVKMAEARAAQ